MPDINDLRSERSQAISAARELLDRADKEKRNLTSDESAKYDELIGKQDELRSQVQREERQQDLERELAKSKIITDPDAAKELQSDKRKLNTSDLEMRGFGQFVKGGRDAITGDEGAAFRAMQADNNTLGGYLVAPQKFVASLIKDLDNEVFMRRIANVLPTLTNAQSLGIPSLDEDMEDATWTSEVPPGGVNEDTAMRFGKRELSPEMLAKRIKVSEKLLRIASMNPEEIVRQRMMYKFAVTEENAFLNGNGAAQPLGVFTAAANGISTGRDVSTGNTSTSVTFDGLKEAKYSLKAGYIGNASWIGHRDFVKQVSKLKDGEGQYIWQSSVTAGDPDMLLGMPLYMSEYAPNTFTTGQYAAILGDFSYYWIVDSLNMQIQRLNELYAETNQVGFIGRKETDAMPVLENAFARVKLA